jgi:hypothetical protein
MHLQFDSAVKNKSNTELLSMVYQVDVWSPEMLEAVRNELSSRQILPADLHQKLQKQTEADEITMSKGKEGSVAVLILGWITVLGFLGLAIGYHYAYAKVRSNVTGKQYFKYDEDTRKDGKLLINVSLIGMIASFVYLLLRL